MNKTLPTSGVGATAVSTSAPARRLRVLWIDDEQSVVESSRERLRRNGIDVDGASNGTEGLRLARLFSYDLIILDEKMPELTGLDVLAHLHEQRNKVPVMFLTAYPTPDHAFEARGLGAVKYYQKPLCGQGLVQAILTTIAATGPGSKETPLGATQTVSARLPHGHQTTWRPSDEELMFLDRVAEHRGISRNTALRYLVRAAMKPRKP